MKNLTVLLAVFFFAKAMSQDAPLLPVQQRMIEFNGGNYNANVIDVAAPPDMVEAVLTESFAKQGVKPKEIDDFMVFRNVKINSLNKYKNLDVFIKIERKSRREKEASTISFIATRPGEIGDEKIKSATPSTVVTLGTPSAVSRIFLQSLKPEIDEKLYQRDLLEKQMAIKQNEKKLQDLQDDQASLERKLKSLEDDLDNNRSEQKSLSAELKKLKAELEEMLAKKTGIKQG